MSNTIKNRLIRLKSLFGILVILALPFIGSASAYASGSASFSISPSSGSYSGNSLSVAIYENSNAVAVDTVQVYLDYTNLSSPSISLSGSAFTTCPQAPSASGGQISIGCALFGSSVTGNQLVATISFTVPNTAISSSVQVVDGPPNAPTQIIEISDYANIWNGSQTTASFSATAAPTCPSGDTGTPPNCTSPPPSGGGGTQSNNNTNNKKQSTPNNSNKTNSTTNSTPTQSTTPTTTPTVTGSSTSTSPTSSSGTSLPAASGVVNLVITNSSGTPIDNAKVTLGSSTKYTNKDGMVSFSDLTIGEHKVTVQAPGKSTLTSTFTLNPGKQIQSTYKLKLSNSRNTAEVSVGIVSLVGLLAIVFAARYWIIGHKRFKPHHISDSQAVVSDHSIKGSSSADNTDSESQIITPKSSDNSTLDQDIDKYNIPISELERKVAPNKYNKHHDGS